MHRSLLVRGLCWALLACVSICPALVHAAPVKGNAAAKLLYQGSFGPTATSLAITERLTAQQWLDMQMQLSPTWHYPLTKKYCSKPAKLSCLQAQESVWLQHALTAEDQLRQRVAFALSQILVVSSKEPPLAKYGDGLAWYYDILLKHSFGNYRDLLQDVTLSPAMGVYLSMQGNRKANPRKNTFPDENYAREVMQLFSIGLYQLDSSGQAILDDQGQKIPSYQQADVENLARVFTGWDIAENKRYGHSRSGRYDTFMELNPKQHDYGAKVLFGQPIAADLSAKKELEISLDLLFNHPNVGPFISRQLIQRLVSSNPSPAYVARVAKVFNNNGKQVRGDLGAVVQAILLDAEARGPVAAPAVKLKEPLLRYVGFLRAFSAQPKADNYRLRGMSKTFGQGPLRSPSVFNFYQPDYIPSYLPNSQPNSQPQPPSDDYVSRVVVPEAEIMIDPLVIKQLSKVFKQTMSNRASFSLDLQPALRLANNSDEMLEYLNQLLLAGKMTPAFKAKLLAHLSTVKGQKNQLKEAIYLIVTAADYALQP